MCGRYTLTTPLEGIRAAFEVEAGLNLMPRYNIAPTQEVVAVRAGAEGGRELVLLRWGLVPAWAKDRTIASRLINARSESVAEKPSFRRAFAARRCLLPADGFYEWRKEGATKQPYRITLADERVFAFAGLWEHWRDPQDGEELETCTILTTEAHPSIAEIHPRMPVILPRSDYAAWLDRDSPRDELLGMMVPYGERPLKADRVSPRVNKVVNDDPSLLSPLENEAPDDGPVESSGPTSPSQGKLF
jgi:putative SOS response-associated peptidase YedK